MKTHNLHRIEKVQCMVYGLSGSVLGLFTLMMAIPDTDNKLSLEARLASSLGSFGLLASAALSLKSPFLGRSLAILSLFGLGYVWFPTVILLVPRPGLHVPVHIYLSVVLYFFTVFFAIFFPRPNVFTVFIFYLLSIVLIYALGLAIATSETFF